MAEKPKLTFDLDAREKAAPQPRPATGHAIIKAEKAAKKAKPQQGGEARTQTGARLSEPLYRRLKAHAALTGQSVRDVLDAAITDYLKHHEA